MKIGIDMDNVLAELSGPWTKWIADHFCIAFHKDDWRRYHIGEVLPSLGGDPVQFLDMPHLFRDLEPLPDAVRVTRDWVTRGHTLVVHSAAYPQHWPDKCHWLGRHFPHIDKGNLIAASAKQYLRFDVRIDDAIHNLANVANEIRILFDQPWNRHWDARDTADRRWPYDIRVGCWAELEYAVLALERAALVQQPLSF